MDVKRRLTACRYPFISSVFLHHVAVDIISQVIGQNIDYLLFKHRVLNDEQRFNTLVKASDHDIGTANIHPGTALIVKVEDASMF